MLKRLGSRNAARFGRCKGAAQGKRATGRLVLVRAQDSDDLLKLQQELLSQIEERKEKQADLENQLRSKAAASRGAASLTVDLDEEYRKTLEKFKSASGSSSGSAASRAAASQPARNAPAQAARSASAQANKAEPSPSSQNAQQRTASQSRPVVVPGRPTLPLDTPRGTASPPAASSVERPQQRAAAPQRAPAQDPAPRRTAPGQPAAPPDPQRQPEPATARPSGLMGREQPAAPGAATQRVASRSPQNPTAPAAPPPSTPPLAGDNAMNIVFVGAECAPWSKTGGLGDVMGSLPKAMQRRGHRVMVISPRYEEYSDAFETGVRQMYRVHNQDTEVGYFHCFRDGVDFVFVDHACFRGRRGGDIYKGERLEIAFRNCLLCKAALEAVWHVPFGGVPYGDDNTVFIANDWHTAVLPVYLQAHYRDHGKMTYARSVLTIHNMAYQGRGPMAELSNFEVPEAYSGHFFMYDPVGGEHMNIMKAGIVTASRVVAVSAGYAWEIQTPEGGWGLHEVLREQNWKLCGIANGIDYNDWHPARDGCLTSDGYMQYSEEDLLEGKAVNKRALQRELGLPERPDVPMLGFIGRMDYQKGVDLIHESYQWLMGEGVQLVMLGSGREDLENALREMENQRKDQCRGWVGFSVPMAHRITAACDMLLMPSRFEPCGLNQLYAMKYGTVPVVHAVGGLRETVQQFNPFEDTGTGWQFERAEGACFRDALGNALYTFREFRGSFNRIAQRGAEQDLSWDRAAAAYEGVLVDAKYQW